MENVSSTITIRLRNSCCNCDNPLTVDHMCRQNSRVQLSAEETIAAEESLSIYCKPVELYNILKRRAQQNPSFLQRCLHYKIQAKHSRRIRMTFSLPGPINGVQAQNILPLHILLARPVSDTAVAGHSAVYNLARVSIVTAPSAFEKKDQSEVNFVLPEINKLSAEAKAGKLTILLVSCGEKRRSLCEGNAFKERMDSTSFSRDVGGYCLWGEIQMESVFLSWLECVSLRRDTSEALATIDMHSCFLETTCLEVGNCISFQIPDNPGTKQLHVNISAQVIGAKERSAYDSVPTSLLPEISRLRRGNVIFIYKYYHNKLQKSEVVFGNYLVLWWRWCVNHHRELKDSVLTSVWASRLGGDPGAESLSASLADPEAFVLEVSSQDPDVGTSRLTSEMDVAAKSLFVTVEHATNDIVEPSSSAA
ncbi:hypothetical protein GIB67_012453 [Kingdonia uniflora]|uniref:DUF7651 domain-containing protein n=1 Tax=Kingdonia uniflora TaxID=39325 RepID=A0A7J7MVK7_9MAGN|nr:hypothetical protein GIB67_012453 [Kingdonia uniflora]